MIHWVGNIRSQTRKRLSDVLTKGKGGMQETREGMKGSFRFLEVVYIKLKIQLEERGLDYCPDRWERVLFVLWIKWRGVPTVAGPSVRI